MKKQESSCRNSVGVQLSAPMIKDADSVPVTSCHRKQNYDTSETPQALYTGRNTMPVCSLHYDWTAWPTKGTELPRNIIAVANDTASLWEQDGIRLLTPSASSEKIQILFDVNPDVSPVFFCMRVKGRLQHALRKAGTAVNFSRKVSFRSLGENTVNVVEKYIQGQVGKEKFADPRFVEIMQQFTVIRKDVALSEPSESGSGRYWYDLHLVLVMDGRFRMTAPGLLLKIRDKAFALAEEGGHRIAALSVMPDHLHAAVRGNIECSPFEIGLEFQNGLARVVGCRAWQDGFYAGTFSEYDLGVIRYFARQS